MTLMRESFTVEERQRYKPRQCRHQGKNGDTPTRSTFRYRDELGNKVIRYHHTNIYTVDGQAGTFIIRNGGWTTPSTKERLNNYMPYGYLHQKDFAWIFCNKGVSIPFESGMELPLSEVDFLNAHVPYGQFTSASHFEYNGVKVRIDDISELPAKPDVFEVQFAYNPT